MFLSLLINTPREQYRVLKFVLFNALVLKGDSKFNNTQRFQGHTDIDSILKIQSLVPGEKNSRFGTENVAHRAWSLTAPEPPLLESGMSGNLPTTTGAITMPHGRSKQHWIPY